MMYKIIGRLLCLLFGRHSPSELMDGANVYGPVKCKWCKFEGWINDKNMFVDGDDFNPARHPSSTMNNKEILERLYEKAVKKGYRPRFPVNAWFTGMFEYKGTEAYKDYYVMIYNPDFVKALNFKLKDLGRWCDEGGHPLKYLEGFLK